MLDRLLDALGDRRGRRRRQLDGRLHLRRARDRLPPARRAPRARLPRGHQHLRSPCRRARCGALQRLERILAAETAWMASKSDTVARRPRLRDATLRLVTRHPDRLPAALAAEQLRGSGKPGFMPGARSQPEYDFRERLQEIACPTLIVWGEDDRVVTARDAAVFSGTDPELARGHLRGHRAHGDARAPGGVQRAAGGVSRASEGPLSARRRPRRRSRPAWRTSGSPRRRAHPRAAGGCRRPGARRSPRRRAPRRAGRCPRRS